MRRISKYIFIYFFLISIFIIRNGILNINNSEIIVDNREFVVEEIKVSGDFLQLSSNNIKIYIRNDDKVQQKFAGFKVGDVLKISGKAKSSLAGKDLSYGLYIKGMGIDYTLFPKEIDLIGHIKSPKYIASYLRQRINIKILSIYGNEYPLVSTLLIGDRQGISKADNLLFSKTGILHIVSISGFHIVLVAEIIKRFLFFIPTRKKYFLVLFFTFGYVLLTGINPPSLRAYIFYLTYILAIFTNNKYDSISIGLILTSIYLAINPYSLFNISFVLSFLAVLSISMYFNRFKYTFSKAFPSNYEKYKFIWDSIFLTISAQILTIPYSYFKFHTLSLTSIASNLLGTPLVSAAYPFMILSLIFSFFRPLAEILSIPAKFLLDFFIIVNKLLASIPNSYIRFGESYLFIMIIIYILIVIEYKIYLSNKLRENKIEQKN